MATEVVSGRYQGLEARDLVAAWRNMMLSRRIDDKEIQLKRQNKIYFQINSVGHEAVTTAAGMVARPGYDWFDLYYRDRAFCLQIGVTSYEMFLQAVGAREDPASAGRQMPSHLQVLLHGHPVSACGRSGRRGLAPEPDRRPGPKGRIPRG